MQHRVLVAVIKLRTYSTYSIYTCSSPSPPHISQFPTIWHTHRTRWPGIGRRRQVPVANSPSPVALLLPSLWRKRGWWMDTSTALGIQSLSETTAAPQPHLTCLFPLRFLRAAVASPFTERVQNAQLQNAFFFYPGEKESQCVNSSLERFLCDPGSAAAWFRPPVKNPKNPAIADCIKSSCQGGPAGCLCTLLGQALKSAVSKM